MSFLAALEAIDVSLIAAILGGCWLVIQILDRLYFNKKPEVSHAEQAVACKFEHEKLGDGLRGLHEAQRDLLRAHADMLRVLNETHGLTRQQAELAQARHREVIDSLARVEAALRQDRMRVVT